MEKSVNESWLVLMLTHRSKISLGEWKSFDEWFSLQQYEGSLFCHIFWPLFYSTIQVGEAKWYRKTNFDRNVINRKELNEAYYLTLAIPKMVWWDGWESFFCINDMRNDTFALFASSHGMSVILTHGTAHWCPISQFLSFLLTVKLHARSLVASFYECS